MDAEEHAKTYVPRIAELQGRASPQDGMEMNQMDLPHTLSAGTPQGKWRTTQDAHRPSGQVLLRPEISSTERIWERGREKAQHGNRDQKEAEAAHG